jgi:peptide/nickel transport system substrate-binding protein
MALASPLTPILPKHIYGDGQDIKTHPANLKPVGSGPFKFVSFTDKEIVLEKYPGFFLPGKPYLDRLIFKIMEIPVIPIAFEIGSVHLHGFAEDQDFQKQMDKSEKNRIEYGGYEGIGAIVWLAFNLRKAPLNDVRVRQAFAYLIDRDFLAKEIYGDKAKVATGPISTESPFYSDKVNKYPVNTDLANKLLDEAGYPRNEKGFRFAVTLASQPAIINGVSEYLSSVLSRKAGVEVKILQFEKATDWSKFVANGDFEMTTDVVYNWGDPVIGVHRTYLSTNIRPGVMWSNNQGYISPIADELMKKAAVETDFVRRKALYAEFQEQVVNDLPICWLYEPPHGTVYNRNLIGFNKASVWGIVFPFTDVYWSK